METKTFFITMLILISINLTLKAQKMANLWYLPSITLYQAENLAKYDLLVIDPENLFSSSDKLDEMLIANPDLKIYLYINSIEIFEPMFNDKPWSMKLLAELQTKKSWWVYQPNGEKISFWEGMKTLDMRADCPEINGERYWQWIAQKYIELLKDSRISGCLFDNAWGDDSIGIEWLATTNGQGGIDLDGDKKADTNFQEISNSWTKGTRAFISAIRESQGDNFSIIANPGNLSYREVDGKQFENFPYRYHHLKGGDHWNINMMIAKKYKIVIINPDEKDLLLGAISSLMLDNAYLCVGQNQMYHDYYNLELGKTSGKTKEISQDLWSRPFENGIVFINTKTKKAWVEYKDGTKREE